MNLLSTMDEDMDLAVVSGDEECCQSLVTDHDCSVIGSLLPPNSVCRVCGDSATGMYFGALVCVPCKVFWALLCPSVCLSVLLWRLHYKLFWRCSLLVSICHRIRYDMIRYGIFIMCSVYCAEQGTARIMWKLKDMNSHNSEEAVPCYGLCT